MPDAVTSSDSGINALVQKLLAASMAKPVSPMAQAPAAAQPKQSSGMSPLALPMAAMAGEQALTSKVDPNPKYKGGAELGNVAGSVAGNYFGGPIGGALGGMAGKFLGGEIGAKKMALLGVLEDGTDRVPQTGPYMLHEGEAVVPADQNPANGSGVSGQKAQLDALVKSLMQRAGAPQPGGMVKPTPRSSPESMQQTGYRTQTFPGNSKGAKMADAGEAISNFGSFVHNAVAQHKQNQVREAMAEWQGFDQALEKAQVLAGDPSDPKYKENVQKYLAADPFVKANLNPSNPKAVKRLKNMYKALNVDLLDGDAENVHRKGLQQMFKAKDAFAKVKAAKDKLEGHQQQQQPVDPAQRQQQFQTSFGKLMNQGTVSAPDPKQMAEAARAGIDLKKAEEDKNEFKQGIDPESGKPTWFRFDKTDPSKPAQRIEIDGKAIGAESKFSQSQIGKVVSIGTKPYGVVGKNGVITPGSPQWGEDEARNYDAANAAYAVQEANREKNTRLRSQTYLSSREYGVIWNKPDGTKQLVEVGPQVINAAAPGTYSPSGAGMTAMGRESKFQDIYWNIDNVEEAAKNLKTGLDEKTRASIIMALRSNDPAHSLSTFVSSEAAKSLKPDVVDYLTALASLQENSMAIATLGGYGQGSDAVREAIARTAPNAGTPSYSYLHRQLTLLRGTAKRLEAGTPQMGNGPVSGADIKAPD
jgi:hypothetical protein